MAHPGASPGARAERECRLAALSERFLAGATQQQLAEEFDVDQSTISRDLATLRKRWEKQALVNVDARIGLQDAQYNALISAHMPVALNGKTWNASVVMQALAQQAKLLGLDRPVKQQVDIGGGIRLEIVGMADEDLP